MDGHENSPQPESFGELMPAFPAPSAAQATGSLASPFPPPVVDGPMVSVVLPEQPKRRRSGLFAGVGLLLAVLLGAGGYLLLRSDTAKASYSLTEASKTAAATKAVAFTMTMTMMGQELTAEAETDSDSGLTHVSMDLGGASLGIEGTIEMIYDAGAKVVYFNSGFFEGLGLEVDTEWLKMDEQFMQEQAGADATLFGTASVGNPLDAGAVFERAKSVTEIGFAEVDGVKVKHYEVVVDASEMLKVSPQLQQQFAEIDGALPDELIYDVYVDEQNQIRRTTTEVSAGGVKAAVDIVIKPSTEPIVIEVPAPDDVSDAADMF